MQLHGFVVATKKIVLQIITYNSAYSVFKKNINKTLKTTTPYQAWAMCQELENAGLQFGQIMISVCDTITKLMEF